MASNRNALLTKTHRVLKKHYTAAVPNLRLPVLEQLIFASCLEDSTEETAQAAFTALKEQFFDWNEVRVSTVTELGEAMSMLADPRDAGRRVKRVLQSVFEANYAYELEQLKKENLGVAVKKLQKYDGVTPYTLAHVTQMALGGHAIPINRGSLEVLYIVGVISEKEKAGYNIPGLERAIPKNKGMEFGSLINQLGGQFRRTPYAPATHKILLEIASDAKDRWPKRGAKKKLAEKVAADKKKAKAAKKAPAAGKKAAAKVSEKATADKKKSAAKKERAAAEKAKKVTAAGKKKTKVVKKKTVSKRISKRKPR